MKLAPAYFFPFLLVFSNSAPLSITHSEFENEGHLASLLKPDCLTGMTICRQIIWIKPLVMRRKNCKVVHLKLNFTSYTSCVGARMTASSERTDT